MAALVIGDGDDEQSERALTAMELQTLDGGTISLDEYRGRPSVVNFFAWVRAMPGRDARLRTGPPGPRRQSRIPWGQPSRPRSRDGKAIVERTGITYDVASDTEGDLFTTLGATAMSTTALVDADGTVMAVYSGELSGQEVAAKIDDLLLA